MPWTLNLTTKRTKKRRRVNLPVLDVVDEADELELVEDETDPFGAWLLAPLPAPLLLTALVAFDVDVADDAILFTGCKLCVLLMLLMLAVWLFVLLELIILLLVVVYSCELGLCNSCASSSASWCFSGESDFVCCCCFISLFSSWPFSLFINIFLKRKWIKIKIFVTIQLF